MAEETLAQNFAEAKDDEFDHEMRIVDRVMAGVHPDELPDDVNPSSVAYFLWRELIQVLFLCGYTSEELVSDVRESALHDAETEGNA